MCLSMVILNFSTDLNQLRQNVRARILICVLRCSVIPDLPLPSLKKDIIIIIIIIIIVDNIIVALRILGQYWLAVAAYS